jgi:hypothetical protein
MTRFIAAALVLLCSHRLSAEPTYAWLKEKPDPAQSLAARNAPPAGFKRIAVEPGSFAEFLRTLPLKPGRPAVLLHDGSEKANQDAHHAIIDIDTGQRDLQQCADAVIRLRAEYLWSDGRRDAITFRFTSGHPCPWPKWAAGERPVIRGNSVTWSKSAAADSSYTSFRRYLDTVFAYAGTLSLGKELKKATEADPIEIGDVFIQGGSPGHAVIVVDVAHDPATRKRVFLLAQSYMPAQDVHILRNPADANLSPWYLAGFGEKLRTPEWEFAKADRRRFQ